MKQAEIDGLLVVRASLDPVSFAANRKPLRFEPSLSGRVRCVDHSFLTPF